MWGVVGRTEAQVITPAPFPPCKPGSSFNASPNKGVTDNTPRPPTLPDMLVEFGTFDIDDDELLYKLLLLQPLMVALLPSGFGADEDEDEFAMLLPFICCVPFVAATEEIPVSLPGVIVLPLAFVLSAGFLLGGCGLRVGMVGSAIEEARGCGSSKGDGAEFGVSAG